MRTPKEIQKDIDAAERSKENFARTAREETDKDYKAGLYGNVDNCNARIDQLVNELEESKRFHRKK